MVQMNKGSLIQMPNAAIMDGFHGHMSAEYQRRIPLSTQGDISATARALQKYTPHMNELIEALVNRIGLEILVQNSWDNPMSIFKMGLLEWGDTVEEIFVGLLKAHTYDSDRDSTAEDLFGTELPPVETSFHKVNREVMYTVTITEVMMQRAFLNTNGLSNMVAQLMEAPSTSDNYDEFLMMCKLFPLYGQNNGYYKVHIDDVTTPGFTDDQITTAARGVLRTVRALSSKLKILSPKYNAAKMYAHAKPEDLVLFVTPELHAAMDVNALAAAFNLPYAETLKRIIDIPQELFGMDDVQAILTTEKFFVVMDTVFTTTTQYNPHKLSNKHFLHHHGILSFSRFAPAIVLTTGPGTEDEEIVDPVTGISSITLEGAAVDVPATPEDPATTDVVRGTKYQLESHGTTATAGVATAVRWTVEGATDWQTHVTHEGVLHVSGTEGVTEAGVVDTEIVVRATTTWVNDADPTAAPKTTSVRLLVTGDSLATWPVPEEE